MTRCSEQEMGRRTACCQARVCDWINVTTDSNLISIIIPVYNIEAYLDACLQSVQRQKYEHFEALLIDDGSTDRSPQICAQYVQTDNRFTYYRKENGGLSDARNHGISLARGQYLAFVDGDDQIEADYLFALFRALRKSEAEVAVCSYTDVFMPEGREESHSIAQLSLTGAYAMKRTLAYQRIEDVVAWNKLYKAELFANIRYPKGKLHEDVFTTYKVLATAHRVTYIDRPLYRYVHRSGSIMSDRHVRGFEVLSAPREAEQFCREYSIKADEELVSFRSILCLSMTKRALGSASWRQEFGQCAWALSELASMPYISNSYLSAWQKVYISVLIVMAKLFMRGAARETVSSS